MSDILLSVVNVSHHFELVSRLDGLRHRLATVKGSITSASMLAREKPSGSSENLAAIRRRRPAWFCCSAKIR